MMIVIYKKNCNYNNESIKAPEVTFFGPAFNSNGF
jgi:hypothetical protein